MLRTKLIRYSSGSAAASTIPAMNTTGPMMSVAVVAGCAIPVCLYAAQPPKITAAGASMSR